MTFLGFVAVSGLSLSGYSTHKSFSGGGIYDSQEDFSLNSNTMILFAFVLVTAFVLSWGYFTLARAFTKQFIWITGILQIVFGVGTAIYYFYRHYYSSAVVFLLFAIFSIFCFISWIPRIPFSVLMLQTTMDVAKRHGHVFTVSAIGGFVAFAFGAWYSVTLAAIYVQYQPDSKGRCPTGSGCSTAKVVGLIVFITFAGFVSLLPIPNPTSSLLLLTPLSSSGLANGSKTPSTPPSPVSTALGSSAPANPAACLAAPPAAPSNAA